MRVVYWYRVDKDHVLVKYPDGEMRVFDSKHGVLHTGLTFNLG